MNRADKKLEALEKRVLLLEQVIKEAGLMGTEQKEAIKSGEIKLSNQKPVAENLETFSQETSLNKPSMPEQRNAQRPKARKERPKDGEAVVGKYLIGTLSAILIFVACASFASLVWDQISDVLKLSLMVGISGLISAAGFWLVKNKRSPIAAVTLGIGAGSLFISILSANLAFSLIGDHITLLLAGLWAVSFLMASRGTELYFLTVIAYIGSLVTLLFGTTLMEGDSDLFLLTVFALCIAIVMAVTSWKGRPLYRQLNTSLSMFSFSVLLFASLMDGFSSVEKMLGQYYTQVALVLILYVLLNLLYKLLDQTKALPVYLIPSFLMSILSLFTLLYLSETYFNWTTVTCYWVFFFIHLLELLFSRVFLKAIDKPLTIFYSIILTLNYMFIGGELYNSPAGIVIIGLGLLLSDRLLKKKTSELWVMTLIIVDALLLLIGPKDYLICAFIGLAGVSMTYFILKEEVERQKTKHGEILKIMGLIIFVFTCFSVSYTAGELLHVDRLSGHLSTAIGYFLSASLVIFLIAKGYAKGEKLSIDTSEELALKPEKRLKFAIHVVLIFLYGLGLLEVKASDLLSVQLLMTFSVLAVALTQTRELLLRENKDNLISGLWIVMKYLLLTWTVIWSYFDYGIDSVIYSVLGIAVAIISILVGFKLRVKSVRLYGLVLTLLMVAKFILVDLSQENSMTRVLALIVGGVLCFVISYIYNKVSTSLEKS